MRDEGEDEGASWLGTFHRVVCDAETPLGTDRRMNHDAGPDADYSPTANLLAIASPGCGKAELLARRAARLLASTAWPGRQGGA